jgi:dTDP-4-dehydrorhamnose reductase
MTEQIVILGADGQLGRAFSSLMPHAVFLNRQNLDIGHPRQVVEKILRERAPNVVINCAAYTNVDRAEIEEERATTINGRAVGLLASVCHDLGAMFISYSSDYVFDGRFFGRPYREDDSTNPLSAYGRSKRLGEQLAGGNGCIIRTSWVYGDGRNFVRTMLKMATDNELAEVSIIDDQLGRPTYAVDLARATLRLLKTRPLPPVLHISNSGEELSWAAFARSIFQTAGLSVRVMPISTEEYLRRRSGQIIAQRPHYSVLDLSVIEERGVCMRPWNQALAEHLIA